MYIPSLLQKVILQSLATDSDKWCFFPSLPIVCGKSTYAADRGNVVQNVAEDACRKASYGHPTLTPGYLLLIAGMECALASKL